MDPVKLLADQIKQYQEHNERDHERLENNMRENHQKIESKIDEVLAMMQAVNSEVNSHKKRLENLEQGQQDIKDTVNEIDDRVKKIEKKQIESDHLRNWIIKGLTVATVIVGLVTAVWKFGIF